MCKEQKYLFLEQKYLETQTAVKHDYILLLINAQIN